MQGQDSFVIVDKDLLRGYFDVNVEIEKQKVIGYKLCIVEDWVLDNNKGFCCFLEPSHDPQDTVIVDIVHPKNPSFILTTLQSIIQKALVQQYEIKLEPIKDTLVGNTGKVVGVGVVCSSVSSANSAFKNLSLRYLDNTEPQDFESNRLAISYLATLRCLGCIEAPNTHNRSNSTSGSTTINKGVSDAISRAETVFRKNYKVYTAALAAISQGGPNFNAESVPHAAESIVKDVKMALVHLHYLPFMTKIDGVFTTILTAALAKFQSDYNSKWDLDKDKPQLIPTGMITPECLTALLSRMLELKKKLDVLGFNKTNDNKQQQTITFPMVVRLFNERAKTDTSHRARGSSTPAVVVTGSGGEDKDRDKEQIKDGHSPRITEEDRALLESLGASNSHAEMKKKSKERKGKKEDPIENELRRKLSLLSSTSSSNINTPPPPPPPPPPADPMDDTYVICERERFTRWASEHGLLLGETEVMVGYKLSVVAEWMSKSSQLWSVVEFTGLPSDKVMTCTVGLRTSLRNSGAPPSPGKRKALSNLMHHPSFSGFYSIHTPRGQLVLYDRNNTSSRNLTFIPIPDGNFDAHIPSLQLQMTLQRFGCSVYPPVAISVDVQTLPLETTFLKVYAPYLPPHMEVATTPPKPKCTLAAATLLVSEVQAALCHLNYLPLLAKIDGILDTRTEYAIKAFQKDHSHTNPDGSIDIGTYKDIRNSVVQLSTRLASLGFTPPHDPVRSYHSFNKLIRSFQAEYGAYPEAPGKNVLQALDKLHLGSSSESSGLSMRGARGAEQYLPTSLPIPGCGCLSFMAKASDNIIVVFTSTHPQGQQQTPAPQTDLQPHRFSPQFLQRPLSPAVQGSPRSTSPINTPDAQPDQHSLHTSQHLSQSPALTSTAYPHSPALHAGSVPPLSLPSLDPADSQVYTLVIGSGTNSQTVIKKTSSNHAHTFAHAHSPPPVTPVIVATSTSPQAVVSPGVWDTYWVSVDAGVGLVVFGKGEVSLDNILLKYKDPFPLHHVSHIGLSCWENPVDFSQIRVGSPLPRADTEEIYVSSPHSTEDEIKEINWNNRGRRSLSTSPLPQRRSPGSAITSPTPPNAPSSFGSSEYAFEGTGVGGVTGVGLVGGGGGSGFFTMEADNRVSPVAWDDQNVESEEELFSDEDKYSHKALEEKEMLKAHIIKLSEMLQAQKETTHALQEELADLTMCYTSLKEESLKAVANLKSNERLLKDLNEKYSRVFQVEIPDMLDRLSANSHSLQTYNVKIKRLDDIVQDVHKKNDRHILKSIFWTLLTWVLSVVAFIALGVTTITNSVRLAALRLLPPAPAYTPVATPDPSAELSLFIKEQKAKLDKFMGELKED